MPAIPEIKYINPFIGLRAFEESEDYLFFGRSTQIDELLKKFNDSRFLAVIGSSGSGKSSLVKSGLLPAIYSGFMKVGSNWRVALMQPGEDPIGYLTKQLAEEDVLFSGIDNAEIPFDSVIESRLRRSEKGLMHVYADAHLPEGENLLIVVDQFEELFRFSKYEKDNKLGKSDAMHFIQILLTAAQQKEYPIYVLLTMRSDFLGDCAEFRGLPEAINNGQYLVPRMTRDEIREAITGPVAVSNATISQRLVTRLLNDINNDTDQLPILQHAMMRTWDAWYKRNQHDTPVDFEDYDKIGTMKTALSLHADEAYNELKTENEQHICELMFKALTDKAADLRGIRRPRTIADLCLLTEGTESAIKNQVEIFRKPGRTFLTPAYGISLSNDSIIDISHESLMRVWDRLIKWAEEEARSGDIYLRLAASARLHQAGERGLLKDPELQIALRWKERNKPTPKWSEGFKTDFEQVMKYLDNSRDEDVEEKKKLAKLADERLAAEKREAKRKQKNLIFVLMALLLLGTIGSTIYFNRLSAKNTRLAEDAIDSSEVANNLRIKADSSARIADSLRMIADTSAKKAIGSSIVANTLRQKADSSAKVSDSLSKIAKYSADEAKLSAEDAKRSAAEAEKQKKIASDQNLKNAPSEYARRIREGPVNRKDIRKDTFEFKLLAYADHIETLGPLITNTGDEQAIDKYNVLRDKLYYNNELYEKIYASLINTVPSEAKKTVFKKLDKYDGAFTGELDPKDTDVIQAGKLSGRKIKALVKDKTDHLVICSTDDNWIYVYQSANNKLQLESKIPMGAPVTAIDYNHRFNIIYFGIENGDIGYLEYGINKRNQPVFENTLGSPITSLHLFGCNSLGKQRTFLLAAAKRSRVVMYALDSLRPEPDKKLMGNVLPEKNLVEVTNAIFDDKLKQVIIKVRSSKNGSEIIYQWDPFTEQILEKYRDNKQDPGYKEKYLLPTKIY